MNIPLATTIFFSFVIFLAHTFGGEFDVHRPLLNQEIPIILKVYISVLWHAATAILFLDFVMLGVAYYKEHLKVPFIIIVLLHSIVFAVLFMFYGIFYLDSLMGAPQWIAFWVLALMCFFAIRKDYKKTLGLS